MYFTLFRGNSQKVYNKRCYATVPEDRPHKPPLKFILLFQELWYSPLKKILSIVQRYLHKQARAIFISL